MGAKTMIIDAKKRFSQYSVGTWFQKISGKNTRQLCEVLPLRAEPEVSAEQGLDNPSVEFSQAEVQLLRDSVPLLGTNGREIADRFYKKVVYFMWWDRDGFKQLVESESERFVLALVGHAQNPSESASLAFFLADTWVTYRFKGDLGEPYATVTEFLAKALQDVLWTQLSPQARDAWKKALDPRHVFDTGLSFGVSPMSGDERFNRNR